VDETDPAPWLVVILTSPLGLAWSDADVGAGFTVDAELFEQVADTDISGFYDRLYCSDGSFVGVQIAPLAWPTLAQELPELEYVRSMSESIQLHVLFRLAPPDVTVVWDQSFGGRIYRSFGGTFALSFDTFFLSDDERETIAAAPAPWVTVESVED
jgi:hypothetical protein